MNINFINITFSNVNYNFYNKKSKSSNPIFQAKHSQSVPEIEALLAESKKFYQEIYNRPTSIVKIPNMSSKSVVIEDSLPITSPHLLLLYKDKFNYSLAEKYNDKSFHDDFGIIFNTLKFLYPKQNIVFFEHGSGNQNINGHNIKINAGKSVVIAHGHFCVLPDSNSKFDEIIKKTKSTLANNNWKNIDNVLVKENELIPNSFAIFKNVCNDYNNEYPPYIAISEMNTSDNRSKSATFIQKNINAQTPSQCLRKILAEIVLNQNNPLFWDWKKFFSEILNGNKSNFILKRIEQVREGSILFKNRLKMIQNK